MRDRTKLLGAVVLVVATIVCYLPALPGGFIWDDDLILTDNPTIESDRGLGRIWLEPRSMRQYYPLTWTTFWLEYRLWGLDPRGYRAFNVLLHAASALLVWRLLSRLAVKGAWFGAALFALCPVHVESVAWISERKNVLSGLFYLLALLAWMAFERGLAGGEGRGPRRYAVLSLMLFACAVLSKTVTLTLPAAILLFLWWKKRLDAGAVLRVTPMFLIGVPLGLVTVWLERVEVGAQGLEWSLSFIERVLIAGRALWFYATKLVFPGPLVFVYPRWTIDAGVLWQFLFPLGYVVLVVLLWWFRDRLTRGPLVAALFFAGTLLPALGFFDVYPMRFSFVADHFQYLASLAVLSCVAGAVWTVVASRSRPLALTVSALAVIVYAGLLFVRAGQYSSYERLLRDTIAKNPAAWMAHQNLGSLLARSDRFTEARPHWEEVLRLDPGNGDASRNLGVYYERQGDLGRAVPHWIASLRAWPTSAWPEIVDAYRFLGVRPRPDGTVDLGAMPPADLHARLGAAYARHGYTSTAEYHYEAALRLDPANAGAHLLLGRVQQARGDTRSAVHHYREAIRARPDWVEPLHWLSWILATDGDPAVHDPAMALALAERAAARRSGEDPRTLTILAAAYAANGRYADAVSAAERARHLATAGGLAALAAELDEQLRAYRSQRPFRTGSGGDR